MGHGVTESDRMFSVRIAPWHKDETGDRTAVLQEYPGRKEAMRYSGQDFPIVEVPAMTPNTDSPDWASGVMGVKTEGWKALKNGKSNKVLAYVKEGYEVIQPDAMWDLTEAILGTDSDVKWETGGTLNDGEVMWVLARVDRPFVVTGDDSPIYPFVAGSTQNNGKGSLKFQNIMTRIVCYNTWNAAQGESEKTGREYTFRHVKNVGKRIEQAQKVLAGATIQAHAFQELAEALVKVPFSDKAIEQFIVEFIPAPVDTLISDRVAQNIDKARATVKRLFFESQTVNDNIRNTGYGALMVGTEYLDHLRGYKNNGTYLKRTLLRPETLKDRLVPMIERISESNPPSKQLVAV